jgi:hypothetical protein
MTTSHTHIRALAPVLTGFAGMSVRKLVSSPV